MKNKVEILSSEELDEIVRDIFQEWLAEVTRLLLDCFEKENEEIS